MFERYTEKARRAIFFARYEASHFGSPYMETEHLLLGLLREDRALVHQLLPPTSEESIRALIEGRTPVRKKVSTSVDLPLSDEFKRVLAYAAEEAERLSHKQISTKHLLLGLLREQGCTAALILRENGLDLGKAREWAALESGSVASTKIADGTSGSRELPIIEFVCAGEMIGSAEYALSPIPRTGEQVVLKDKEWKDASYRIVNVTYSYDNQPQAVGRQLAKVVIELKRE